jgi:hypothetical protein
MAEVRRLGSDPPRLLALSICAALIGGCGGSGGSKPPNAAVGQSSTAVSSPSAAGTSVPSEATHVATGDIPDNQVFLTFTDSAAGFSIRYPEGWTRQGSGAEVTFSARANVIHVLLMRGVPSTHASVAVGLAALKRVDPTVQASEPRSLSIGAFPVIKVTYTRLSAADPVTGKRLALTIDRYVYSHAGKVAFVDLATPKGVDNVDAYRMISRSFRWR